MALNFAYEEEAELFLHCAKTTVANRNRRREGKEIKKILSVFEGLLINFVMFSGEKYFFSKDNLKYLSLFK